MAIDTINSKKIIIKRDIKEIFPKEFVNRELISKFFDYIINNFFQQSYEKYNNGYIGKKTVAMEKGDFYLNEPTLERQIYQLNPLIKSTYKNEIVDYTNFINELKIHGCFIDNQNRLLSNNYWSWCPPINVDMFLNYNFYYWIEEGPDFYELHNTDVKSEIIGQKNYSYTYYENQTEVSINFTSGMRIKIINDKNTEFNNNIYIVEGVGNSIYFVEDNEIIYSRDNSPDYYVMERGCIDGNPWSKRNRWFHRSALNNISENMQKKFQQAKKPILCFNKDIKLYNFGEYDRGSVDLLLKTSKNKINGTKNILQQNVTLTDGMKILLIDGEESMIYEISGISLNGVIILRPVINGLSNDGTPTIGESIYVKNGLYATQYYYYDGNEWIYGQQKELINQSPLFNLYNDDKICLSDKLVYPKSTFMGNKLFDYKTTTDKTTIIDSDLSKRIVTSGYGNYIFENILVKEEYTYLNYNSIDKIDGYKYYKLNGQDVYLNNWYFSNNNINQYIVTETNVSELNKEDNKFIINLLLTPDEQTNQRNIYVYINGEILNEKEDYILDNNKIILMNENILDTDIIFIKLLKTNVDKLPSGYFYDLPLSLTANGKNEDITEIKYNECFDQMKSIIENQVGITGNPIALNNYNDTKKDLSLGTEILQHTAPIAKTMLLNSKEFTKISNVLNYISSEYSKFKNKFRIIIENMSNNGEYNEYTSKNVVINGIPQTILEETNVQDIIKKALEKMNIGKNGLFPFYNNGVAESLGNCYIPSTPAYLGLDNCYEPKIIEISTPTSYQSVLLCHDGSYTPLFNDYRDNALLEMEKYIYNSILDKFKTSFPYYNKFKFIPGKFRKTDYSYNEYISLLSPIFEKWCQLNRVDYTVNDYYDRNDPFTWNWSSCYDDEGNNVQGSYRAIYMYYYDTYRPHTHPWEMLGFSNKPEWWESHYGKAPYTSSNIPMWLDIENGYVADGENKGYYEEFKRPNLIKKYLPVDKNGKLLNPYEIGITTSQPLSYYAKDNWKIGDMGRVETAWMFTSEYRYSLQLLLYLMKPVYWVEMNWDTENNKFIFRNTTYEQYINDEFGRRVTPKDIILHNELYNNEYVKHIGIQQWISDYIVNENINITDYIGEPIRNIELNLGYKCGCFYKKDSIKLVSDNYGIIPSQNIHLNLYKTLSSNQYNYSAIIIQKVENGYMIDGYDLDKPYFNVLLPEYNGKKTSIEQNNKNYIYYNQWTNNVIKVKYKTVYTSIQELYTIINGYGKYLETNEGWVFNTLDKNGEIVNFRSKSMDFLIWANLSLKNGSVILLNPGCSSISINHEAFIDKIGQYINGQWSIVDTSSQPIYNDKINVYRQDNFTTIEPTEKLLTLLKVRIVENEHLITIDNTTIFNDKLYDSLLCVKTQRLKLLGVAVDGWNGSFFAPGYLIEDDGAIENYDKLAEDFKYYYDTDDIRSFGIFGEYAKKTIGFQKYPYMERLLIDDRNIFNFYKGLLKEKGTKLAFGKLNRSNKITNSNQSKIDLYENWAFKAGEFGYTNNDSIIELNIEPQYISQNPQIVTFSINDTIKSNKDSVQITWNDKNWIRKKDNKEENKFEYKENNKLYSNGGYVQINEVDHIYADMNELNDDIDNIQNNEKCWVIKYNNKGWNVLKKYNDTFIELRNTTFEMLNSFDTSVLNKNDLLYVDRINISKYLYMINDSNNLTKLNESIIDKNAWAVFSYNGDNEYDKIISYPNNLILQTDEKTLSIQKNVSVKFVNGKQDDELIYEDYKLENIINISVNKDTKYIGFDNNGNGYAITNLYIQDERPIGGINNSIWYSPLEHKTYIYNDNWEEQKIVLVASVEIYYDSLSDNSSILSFTPFVPYSLSRLEEKIIDINLIKSCYMVNNETDETLVEVQLYDPLQGILPNNVLSEINYVSSHDPVNYDDKNSWDNIKEGYLWWDLSKVKYINYYQGDLIYRRNNWGKQLPGSEIAIMEWTKSNSLPDYVTKYIVKEEYNFMTLSYDKWYFYWEQNPSTIPNKDFRKMSAFTISQIINSPQDMDIVWIAPIQLSNNLSESSFIIGNFDKISVGKSFVIQMNFKITDEINEHVEWILVKEDTDDDIPTFLWDKLKDSLTGYNKLGEVVPNPSLINENKYGISIRPCQTMFKDLIEARHNFVDVVNNVFNTRDISKQIDVDNMEWKNIFNDVDKPTVSVDYIVKNHLELDLLEDIDLVGKNILVEQDELYDDIWTVWYLETLTSYKLVEYQKYNMTKFWNYIDLYKDEMTKFLIPTYELSNESDLLIMLNNGYLKDGDIIKTYLADTGDWIIKEYKNNSLYTIALQNGSVYINDNIYSYMLDENIINDKTIFIDNMTKYEYLDKEVAIVIKNILSYFEI